MPSSYESYGRTAIEAGASGIPVICTPTIGLKEALGAAGIYCERNNLNQWVDQVVKLDNENKYKRASKKIYKRALELNPYKQLNNLLKFLENEIYS
jgi:glycosyltransferase involved in cell wall biosynthesis